MPYDDRKPLMAAIESLRPGRKLICFLNFDRHSEPQIPGLSTHFAWDTKEALFRVLKESTPKKEKIDLFFYTRGGDLNSVWPIVHLLREFDPDFEVIIPFRCHSAGALLTLGARKLTMTPIAELGPVDPSVNSPFNPANPANPRLTLDISVEDVQAYRDFLQDQFNRSGKFRESFWWRRFFDKPLMKLLSKIHPLAIGNVHRTHQQIKQLARKLLLLHPLKQGDIGQIIDKLTTGFYSHYHSIVRSEALEILGSDRVVFASLDLAEAADKLLRQYETDFELRKPFFCSALLGNELEKGARFIGGSVESSARSYLFETNITVRQVNEMPSGINIQLQIGQPWPLTPGLPRLYHSSVTSQAWVHNPGPKGVTI